MRYAHQIDLDPQIAALARRQHGNVTRTQLLAVGLGKSAIGHRCRHGRLFPIHLGVYGVGRPALTPLERASAAVLACGSGAALSHQSALALWAMTSRWTEPLHVTCPSKRTRPGIVTHRASTLTRADVRTQLGIRATSPARTLLDCAPDLPKHQLQRKLADARRAGLIHLDTLLDVTTRFPTRPGSPRLRALIAHSGAPTRSEFEDAFIDFCAHHGLPAPLINTRVAGHEVDALFEAERLIVELDGWEFHRDRHSFESDRDRDADTLAAGCSTVRVTWERMTLRAQREADRLRRILAARQPRV